MSKPKDTKSASTYNMKTDKSSVIDKKLANLLLKNNAELLSVICHTTFVGNTAASVSVGVLAMLRNQKSGSAEFFLKRLISSRVEEYLCKGRDLTDIIRDNSMPTMMLTAYVNYEGATYLSHCLAKSIELALPFIDQCEIDLDKLGNHANSGSREPDVLVLENTQRLIDVCGIFVNGIMRSRDQMPPKIRKMCRFLNSIMSDVNYILNSNHSYTRTQLSTILKPVASQTGAQEEDLLESDNIGKSSSDGEENQQEFEKPSSKFRSVFSIRKKEKPKLEKKSETIRQRQNGSTSSNESVKSNRTSIFQILKHDNPQSPEKEKARKLSQPILSTDLTERLKTTYNDQSNEDLNNGELSPIPASISSQAATISVVSPVVSPSLLGRKSTTDRLNCDASGSIRRANTSVFMQIRSVRTSVVGGSNRGSGLSGVLSIADKVVGSFLFLRFIVPAITTPETHGFITTKLTSSSRRGLILVGKVLTALCNDFEFGSKESCMMAMNPFLKENKDRFKDFLNFAALPSSGSNPNLLSQSDISSSKESIIDNSKVEEDFLNQSASSTATTLTQQLKNLKPSNSNSGNATSFTAISRHQNISASLPSPNTHSTPLHPGKSRSMEICDTENFFTYLAKSLTKLEADVLDKINGTASGSSPVLTNQQQALFPNGTPVVVNEYRPVYSEQLMVSFVELKRLLGNSKYADFDRQEKNVDSSFTEKLGKMKKTLFQNSKKPPSTSCEDLITRPNLIAPSPVSNFKISKTDSVVTVVKGKSIPNLTSNNVLK